MRLRVLSLAILVLVLSSCASLIGGDAHTAAASAVDAITTPEATRKLDAIVASATGTARDTALDEETTRRLERMVDALGLDLRSQLLATRDAFLDRALRSEIARLRADLLGPETGRMVAALIEEELGPALEREAAKIREQLVGAGLQSDLDALVDREAPHLREALRPVQKDADEVKWAAVAVGISLLVCLIALGVVLHMFRSHRQILAAMRATR